MFFAWMMEGKRSFEVWERDELPIDLRLERQKSGRVLVWAVYEQQYRCCFEMLLKEVYNNKNKRRKV